MGNKLSGRRILTAFLALVLILCSALPAFAADASAAPTLNQPYEGDETVTGTGVAGAQVGVLLPDGSWPVAVVDGNGRWSVSTAPLAPGAMVAAQQFEAGKGPSEIVYIKVLALDPVSAPPTIDPIHGGDETVTGTGVAGSQVGVLFPDGQRPIVIVDQDGGWSVGATTVLAAGNVVMAQQVEPGKDASVIVSSVVLAVVEVSAEPEHVWGLSEGWDEVSGRGIIGATIEIVLPGDIIVTTTVQETDYWDPNIGYWLVEIGDLVYLNEGDIVYVAQTEPGKLRSEWVEIYVKASISPPGQKEYSTPPIINDITEGDQEITGTGVPYAEVTVTIADSEMVIWELEAVEVRYDGSWSVTSPVPLYEGAFVLAYQIQHGYEPSDYAYTTV